MLACSPLYNIYSSGPHRYSIFTQKEKLKGKTDVFTQNAVDTPFLMWKTIEQLRMQWLIVSA